MASEQRREILTRLLDDPHPAVQKVAAAALERLDAAASIDVLLARLKSGGTADQVQAIYGLAKSPGARALKILVQALLHPKLDIATAAARALVELRDPRLAKPFSDALATAAPMVRTILIEGLGQLRDRRGVPGILGVLDELDEDGLERALQALGRIGDSGAEAAIVPYTKHSNPRVRAAAALALGSLGPDEE